MSQGFEHLGRDFLGSRTAKRKYPRGDAGRSRPPLRAGTRYDCALGVGGQIIFFGEGKLGELGGDPFELRSILSWLGLEVVCANTIRLDYYRAQDARSRAAGESNRNFFITHAAHEYKMSREYVQELFTRDYLYRDEIDPRWELAGRGATALIEECLPGLVTKRHSKDQEAFKALTMLLQVLPGYVYEANLLEFMFEHREANGDDKVRYDWAASRR